jgi:hypothetical protein
VLDPPAPRQNAQPLHLERFGLLALQGVGGTFCQGKISEAFILAYADRRIGACEVIISLANFCTGTDRGCIMVCTKQNGEAASELLHLLWRLGHRNGR